MAKVVPLTIHDIIRDFLYTLENPTGPLFITFIKHLRDEHSRLHNLQIDYNGQSLTIKQIKKQDNLTDEDLWLLDAEYPMLEK